MPVETSIDHERKLVASKFSGVVSGEEMLDYQHTVWGAQELVGFHALIDLSETTRTQVSADIIRELALRSHAIDGTTPAKMAVVVPDSPVPITGAHLFKAACESHPDYARTIRIFGCSNEARSWLGLPKAN